MSCAASQGALAPPFVYRHAYPQHPSPSPSHVPCLSSFCPNVESLECIFDGPPTVVSEESPLLSPSTPYQPITPELPPVSRQ
ncbi:discs large homolog 1-like protein isoform X1 [Tachysurus ichikawai]